MAPPSGGAVNFAFFVHPLGVEDAKLLNPDNKSIERMIIRSKMYLEKFGNPGRMYHYLFDRLRLKPIGKVEVRHRKRRCEGILIFVPYLPNDFQNKEKKKEIVVCLTEGALRAKKYGADYIGMGAFTSIVTGNALELDRKEIVPVTSGSSGTAFGVQLCVERGAKALGISLKKSTLSFIGASGSVGVPSCLLLAQRFKRIVLSARSHAPLRRLQQQLVNELGLDPDSVLIETDISNTVAQADVTVLATNVAGAADLALEPAMINPGSLVVDVGRPRNFSPAEIATAPFLVVDGSIFNFPGKISDESYRFLRMGGPTTAFGCLAETILCGLLGKRVSQSVGSQRSLALVRSVARSMKRRFRLADLRSNDQPLERSRIKEIRAIRRSATRAVRLVRIGLAPHATSP